MAQTHERSGLAADESGHGPPLVLVHGTGVNARFWGGVPAALGDANTVVTYDRRGFGRSAGPPVDDYGVHARDLIALLTDRTGPATVVGWSAGGIVALDVALQRPDLVRTLVFYEPPLHAKGHPSPALLRTVVSVQLRRRLLRDEVGAARTFLRFVFAEPGAGNGMDRWPPELLAEMQRDAHATLLEVDAGTGEHLTPTGIAALAVPVVGIRGDRTSSMPRAAMDRLRLMLPGMPVRTLAGGHGAHLDDPAGFARAVRASDA
jgi:pimeloyl-ACP methyl ester carboxylesterase